LLKRSMAQLEQVKSNILGVILNGMRPEVSPDFQDYKYYRKERRGPEEKEVKKVSRGRLLLLLLAAVLLAAGVFWHNGIIDPFKASEKQRPVKKDEMKAGTKKGVSSKTAIKEKTKIASVKPEPAISKKENRLGAGDSMPKSPAASKDVADIEPPLVKRGTPESGLSKEREAVSHRPKPTASIDKSAAKSVIPEKEGALETIPQKPKSPSVVKKPEPPAVASIPESQPVAKDMAVTKTTPSPQKTVSYPYSLYLGSFKALERAKKAVSFYSENGLSAYWVKVLLSKGTWYRVYAGYFEDSEKAKRFREEKGLEETTVEETPYATLIGVFSSTDELEDKNLSLGRLGYCPYVIRDPGGKFRLYVGAFYPEYRAERQYNELKSSGVRSEVVKR
jgi:cell division septation protein DedD